MNISTNSIQKEMDAKEARKYSKKIFKGLLHLSGELEKYAHLAESIYKKETNLNSATIVKYAEGGV